MRRPSAVAAELAGLTEALDDPAVDIAQLVMGLDAAVRRAVTSAVGLTLDVSAGGEPIVISTRTADVGSGAPIGTAVAASLAVRLPPPVSDPGGSTVSATLTLFATTAGAFVDLAADISWLTGVAASHLVVDGHLAESPTGRPGRLRELSTINQAVGVLVARGRFPDEAVAELDAWADDHGGTRLSAAENVLGGLPGHP